MMEADGETKDPKKIGSKLPVTYSISDVDLKEECAPGLFTIMFAVAVAVLRTVGSPTLITLFGKQPFSGGGGGGGGGGGLNTVSFSSCRSVHKIIVHSYQLGRLLGHVWRS